MKSKDAIFLLQLMIIMLTFHYTYKTMHSEKNPNV